MVTAELLVPLRETFPPGVASLLAQSIVLNLTDEASIPEPALKAILLPAFRVSVASVIRELSLVIILLTVISPVVVVRVVFPCSSTLPVDEFAPNS